jgi:branched-subunit amino acid ABC-type transport system permease component
VGCQTDWETWLVTLIQYAFGGLVSLAGAVVGLIGIGICKTRDRHETKHDVASEAD